MVREYWRRVHKRAFADTLGLLGLGSGGQIVLKGAIGVGAVIALLFFGSSDAARDEFVVRLFFAGLIVFAIPLVYAWSFVAAPPKIEAELQSAYRFEKDEHASKIENLELELDARSSADLFLVSDGNEKWIEVRGKNADAHYIATIDFAETTYTGFGRDPSHVGWSSGSRHCI